MFNSKLNPAFPREGTLPAFGLLDVANRTPLAQQQIGISIGLIPTGGFKIVGAGGFALTGSIRTVEAGTGQIVGNINMQGLTTQTKDF